MKIILICLISLILISSSLAAKNKFTFKGIQKFDDFGNSVSLAGDLNGDGYHDIVIGVPGRDGSTGVVYVIYGGETTSLSDIDFSTSPTLDPLTTGFMITGNAMGDKFGFSVSCAGDINNDGYDDILIGAAYKDYSKGAVYVIYGRKNQDFSNLDLSSQNLDPATTGFMITGNYGWFGYSVSNSGDFNNDGYHDILIGAPYSGAAYLIYGGEKSSASNIDLSSTALDPATTGFTLTGEAWSDDLDTRFGHSVSSAGDIDKDGYDDLTIGAWRNDGSTGAAYVIYGGKKSAMSNIFLSEKSLKPATTGFKIQGKEAYDKLGFSVGSAGDFNNDGYDDIIVGAVGFGGSQGAAYVIYGRKRSSLSNIDLSKATLNPAKTGMEILGQTIGDRFGKSVSSTGDFNKDGFDDVLIGADEKGGFDGAAYVIYGGSQANMKLSKVTLDPAKNGFMIRGTYTYAEFGNSVSSGDINNDGLSDLLIGAWAEESSPGFAYAFVSEKCMDNHCGKCNYFEATCSACSLGYWPDNGICQACIANCDTCGDSSTCQICSAGFSLLGTTICQVGCPVEMYSENRVCQDCPSTCSQCTSKSVCQECKTPYLKYDSQCLASCPVKTYQENMECFDCQMGCSKCTSGSVCQECEEGYTLSESKECVEIDKKREKIIAAVFEGTFLASAALSSGSSLPFNFALVGKISRNLKYLDVTVSSELTETFYSWRANGFLRAPKSWNEKSESKDLPTVFSRSGLDPVFLINFWKPLVLTLIGLVVYVIFKLAEIIIKRKKKGIFLTISRHVNIAASNFALTIFYCNLDDVLLYLVIEFRSTKFDNGFRIFSSVLAIVLLVLGCVLMCLHWIFVREYQKLKNAEPILETFKMKYFDNSLQIFDFQSHFRNTFRLPCATNDFAGSLEYWNGCGSACKKPLQRNSLQMG